MGLEVMERERTKRSVVRWGSVTALTLALTSAGVLPIALDRGVYEQRDVFEEFQVRWIDPEPEGDLHEILTRPCDCLLWAYQEGAPIGTALRIAPVVPGRYEAFLAEGADRFVFALEPR